MNFSTKDFRVLAKLVYDKFGIHLEDRKKQMVAVRLNKELRRKNIPSFSAYLEYVRNDKTGTALSDMINLITTNHTFFYREKEHFTFFRDTVLPWLEKTKIQNGKKTLRIWSAGCSSGEEPYSLVMTMMEYFGERYHKLDAGVLATDISSKVLIQAKQAEYAAGKLSKLPPAYRHRYFTKKDKETYRVSDAVRKEVLFKRLNLKSTTFPFSTPFDAIFCRNVMIYFNTEMRGALVNKFYRHLADGGYFFIGHSESIRQSKTGFTYIKPATYRRGGS